MNLDKTKSNSFFFNPIQTSNPRKTQKKYIPGRDKWERESRRSREIDSAKRETRGRVTQSLYDGLEKTPSSVSFLWSNKKKPRREDSQRFNLSLSKTHHPNRFEFEIVLFRKIRRKKKKKRSEEIKEDANSTKLARKKTKEKQTEELLYQYGGGFPSLLKSKGTRFVDSQNVLRFVFPL